MKRVKNVKQEISHTPLYNNTTELMLVLHFTIRLLYSVCVCVSRQLAFIK